MVTVAFSLFVLRAGHPTPPRPPWPCARRSLSMSHPSPPSSAAAPRPSARPAAPARIVCVGDIHGQWNERDESALRGLRPDLALFVGDYGDEDVALTARLATFAAAAPFPVASVFGNHDAFFTASFHGRRRAPYDKGSTCRVTDQMRLMNAVDVSYRSAAVPGAGVSVVGGRAFSAGGPHWKYKDFYLKFFGVRGMQHSTQRMMEAVRSAEFPTIVFLSHGGPTGLGDRPGDPCGKDWGESPGGDYGDDDLREAIRMAREEGYRVPLVVFGHMHKMLMNKAGSRTMVVSERDGDSKGDTVMVNAAVVPRHTTAANSNSSLHHFQVVQIREGGDVGTVEEVWATEHGQVAQTTALYEADPVQTRSFADSPA